MAPELQDRPIELVTPPEELCRAQAVVQELSDRYCDLFDFAQVGYFLLDEHGQILAVNLAGAVLLGQERRNLVKQRFGQFIVLEDRAAFAGFWEQTLKTDRRQVGEFCFRKGEQTVHVQVRATSVATSGGTAKRFRLAVTDVSSIRQTEATLRASQEHYRALVEGADIGITLIDLDYNILSANKKQARIVGHSVDQLIGKKCYREYEGREGVCPHCPGVTAIARGAPADVEATGQRKDGSPFAVHVTASPIVDQNGRMTGFVEVVEDIRERKRREQEIASLAKFPDENPNPILRVDGHGTIRYCDRASLPLLAAWGGQKDQPLPGPWRQIASEALASQSIQQAECVCGQQVFTLTFAPVVDAAYVNVYALDITKRKQAEEELRKFRTISDRANYGAAIADQEGNFVYINDAFARMHGWEAAELLGRPISVFHNEEQRARLEELLGRLLREGGFSAEEAWHVRRDGSVFPTLMNASAIKDASGKTQFTSATAVDITVRKRVEQELRAANTRLEQALARAEELTVRAEAANCAKSEFLANMSHEIRTPMTAILGFSDLLAMPDLPPGEQREFIEGIQRNGRALLELLGNILDLSKIEAEKLTLEKEEVPLRQIVDDVMAVVQVQAEGKKQAVKVDYRFPLPETIRTDPTRLRQILTNLLGNAVKFTGQGEICLTIRYLPDAHGRARMQFAVSDTGIGIPADKTGELFQPFMQVDASASRRYGGTGLGLAISKRLAKALGGDIEVASELGKGSTFTLTMDQGSSEDVLLPQWPRAAAAAGVNPLSKAAEPSLQGRLLLAEDDPSVQRIVCLVLQKMGLEVAVAETGQIACDLAETSRAEGRPYDLILMDIQMPKVNGYEATRWLRQHGWKGPIIALTAHALAGDREKCLAAGCDDYLTKPIVLTALRDALAAYLNQTVPAEQTPVG